MITVDTLSLETARDVLSTHHPESFHVNGYLTCAGSSSYICPTCGRQQHPGETCEPGHADDDSRT